MSGGREGGCARGAVGYRLASEPMFVHCCHCLNYQRQTGSAYYDSSKLWPAEGLERLEAIKAQRAQA